MKETLKILTIYLSRLILSVFHIFPINKKRILFISFSGKSFTCNPKYIFNELVKQNKDYEYIWVLDNKNLAPEHCKAVTYRSLKFYYHFFTSKLLISNYSISSKLPVRKKQILFNTWHGGGAYKKVGLTKINKDQRRVKKVFDILAKETSYFLSSCTIQTKTIIDTFHLDESKVLNLGYPRNDIFFDKTLNIQNMRRRICNELKIDPSKKILLFAPTYRGQPGFGIATEGVSLDIKTICSALSSRFGDDFVCIYRGHYYLNNTVPEGCFDGCSYPDMQELLLISDVLLTDYSSSIWDFSFTNKPCFLYTPDLTEYTQEQEFYEPIDKWGFSYAGTQEELITNINTFDQQQYNSNIQKAHEYFGAFDNGNASAQIAAIITDLIG